MLSGFLLFTTKGKELGISWLLFAVFLGVFGSYEVLHHSNFPVEQHFFLHAISYAMFGWTGFVLGLLLLDGLIDIITFNTVAVVSYVSLSSVASLRPARMWFFSKAGISILVAFLGSLLVHRWPLQALHTTTVVLGAFLVASGTQLLIAHSDSLITSVTECAEVVWSADEAEQRPCYPTYILWPVFAIVAASVRAKRSTTDLDTSLAEPLLGTQGLQDEWLPQLPTGLHGVQKAMKVLLFRVVPGCLRGCYSFLAMAEHATASMH